MKLRKCFGRPRTCGSAFASGYARITLSSSPDTSPPATPTGGPGRYADFLVDPLVRHEPVGIDTSLRRGAPHRAPRLGQMATVVEAALVQVRTKLRETRPQRVGADPPRDRKSTRLNSSHLVIS